MSLCGSPFGVVVLSLWSVVGRTFVGVGGCFSWAPSEVVWALLVFSPLMVVWMMLSSTGSVFGEV